MSATGKECIPSPGPCPQAPEGSSWLAERILGRLKLSALFDYSRHVEQEEMLSFRESVIV